MSLVKIYPEYIEQFSLTLHPKTLFVSSSLGITGTMPLAARPSSNLKEVIDPAKIGSDPWVGFDETVFDAVLALESASETVALANADGTSANIYSTMLGYLDYVDSAPALARNTKNFNILRYEPPVTLDMNFISKRIIRNTLMPFYYARYDQSSFSYTNYHTLNFFTSSQVPSNSAIIYPNYPRDPFPNSSVSNSAVKNNTRPYFPTGSFSFDFYINPRYTLDDPAASFKAGTILHLSSTYAVSLISGSEKIDGLTSAYRILLQLSHSADIPPSQLAVSPTSNKTSTNSGEYPYDLVFLSPDNALKRNQWHHVTIRWGGSSMNAGSGSILVDKAASTFNVPSSSILPPSHIASDALILGNYFEGSGDEKQFFNSTAASSEGVYNIPGAGSSDPTNFSFNHPLNAEIHDVKIFSEYLDDNLVEDFEKFGNSSIRDMIFYVPPFFVKESPTRDVHLTPFETESKSTEDPFNVDFSFGVGGRLINLENFTREMVTGQYPRLYNLTASTLPTLATSITANEYVYASGSTRKRNLTILPNDNGRFVPDYGLLVSGSKQTAMSKFVDPITNTLADMGIININEMVSTGSENRALSIVSTPDIIAARDGTSTSLPDDTSETTLAFLLAGVSPESTAGTAGSILTIFQRTGDPSSNEVEIFDISNLYYGNSIMEKTFSLRDSNITGSGGKVDILLKDNGAGSLYRANCSGSHPVWANVGNVFYNEGLAIVKSPHLPFFGKDQFEATFTGEQNVHTMIVNVPIPVGQFNSSSNPSYRLISASLDANDTDPAFVYISGLNLHDDNLNVIMRLNLSQPIMKRESEEVMIRFKKDF